MLRDPSMELVGIEILEASALGHFELGAERLARRGLHAGTSR
jgi:hypothetical protein